MDLTGEKVQHTRLGIGEITKHYVNNNILEVQYAGGSTKKYSFPSDLLNGVITLENQDLQDQVVQLAK